MQELCYAIEELIFRILKAVQIHLFLDTMESKSFQMKLFGLVDWTPVKSKPTLKELLHHNTQFFKEKHWLKGNRQHFKGLESWTEQFRIDQTSKLLKATAFEAAKANLPTYILNVFQFLAVSTYLHLECFSISRCIRHSFGYDR